jgi:MFS family permease
LSPPRLYPNTVGSNNQRTTLFGAAVLPIVTPPNLAAPILIHRGTRGLGYATQDTLLKALVATVLPEGQRNFAFGLYYAGYGVGWLVGSVVTGLLYEHSLTAMVIFAYGRPTIFAIASRVMSAIGP